MIAVRHHSGPHDHHEHPPNIGTAIAGVLGGYLAAHGYWLLFAIDAGTSLGYAVIVAALLPSDRAKRDSSQEPDSKDASTATGSGYGIVFRDRLTRRLLLLFGVQLFIYSGDRPARRGRGLGISPQTLKRKSTTSPSAMT
jgi:hypothetical protein